MTNSGIAIPRKVIMLHILRRESDDVGAESCSGIDHSKCFSARQITKGTTRACRAKNIASAGNLIIERCSSLGRRLNDTCHLE